ncbi:MAG: hypothetical protein R6X33_05335 [Candidatus Brocadiia bacterium]
METTEEQFELIPLHDGPGTTLLSWNGTCPESPCGQRVAYFRMPVRAAESSQSFTGEIWLCDADLTGHRKLFEIEMRCAGFQHNGGNATWVDDGRLAFRGTAGPMETIFVVDAESGELLHEPIHGGIGHYAVKGKVPFSTTAAESTANAAYPAIDEAGIYALNCDTGSVEKIVATEDVLGFVRSAGYTPTEETPNISHVMLNADADRVMARWDLEECKAIISCDPGGGNWKIIPDKPLHQLWFDEETYVAVYRETGHIHRYAQDGTKLGLLAGPANHFDVSPDKQWLVTDPAYWQTPITIRLYRRGEATPAATLASHELEYPTWELRAHANPVFSRDGRRIYFLYPVSETRVKAVRADIGRLLDQAT